MRLHPPPRFVQLLLGRWGIFVAIFWGFAEGTLFFIVPDVFLTLIALFAIKKSAKFMLVVVLGAMVGGTVMFLWSANSPAARQAVGHVPFVSARMFDTAARNYGDHGAAAMLVGPMSGIPYKTYAVLAPGRVSLPVFLLMSIPARLERFLITWLCAVPVGIFLRSRRKPQTGWMVAIWGVYWVGIYSVYWSVV